MSGVDNRIVTMQFNNKQFEQNAATSLSTLQKLKQSMSFGSIVGGTVRGLGTISSALSKIGLHTPFAPMISAANKGLSMIGGVFDRLGMKNPFSSGVQGASELQRAAQAAGGPQGMGVLEGGVTAVSSKFIALSTIAITALSNITNRAINAGTTFLKSFTFAPVMDGLHEYETNLKSIQTVQANTDRPLPEINDALKQLNEYSDQTIYNFSEMARNVGTFTAAGVDLETSVSSIKGIANMAALSGSSSEQAAGAMYQLSQAIASGKVGLMDWNSVVNAGMGGKKLQGALAQTAVAMGKIDAAQVKGTESGKQLTIMGSSFRESIMAKPGQESWLSSKILTNSLAALDGRYSAAALSAETLKDGTLKYADATGKAVDKVKVQEAIEKARNQAAKDGIKYTDEQFTALQKMSTSAFEAATKVKTLGQVFDIAKETIGSGWSASFESIFGNLKEAKKLFTDMSEGLGEIIKDNALARNVMLATWKERGGRDTLIDGLKNSWQAVLGILGPIRDGFRDIFPAQTAKGLLEMTRNFESFTQKLIPGKETMADIRDIAGGVFSVFSIIKTILGGVITGFVTLFGAVGGGSGGFLDLLAAVGRNVEAFAKFLDQSGLVTLFFTVLGGLLSAPLSLLRGLAGAIASIFDGFDTGKSDAVEKGLWGMEKRATGLAAVADKVREFFSNLGDGLGNLGGIIGKALGSVGDVVASFLTAESFAPALDALNTGLLAAITVAIVKFLKGGMSFDVGGGFFAGIADTLDAATGSLTALQSQLKANALLKIGMAIGVLAAALFLLSTIPPDKMRMALGAMSAGFAVLIGALVVMMKVMGPVGILQIWAISSAMTKMAASILLLAFALKALSSINFGDMLRGLVGLSIMLKILNKAMIPMAAGSKGMVKAAASLILIGVALNILAVALKIFATMSWGEMAKGLVGLAATLTILSLALRIMPDMKAEGIGLVLLAVAMNVLAVALKIFATMSWEEMAKGLTVLALSLGIISAAINTMPKTMMLQAVALVAVAGAMVVLSGALKVMGSMGWEDIAQGLVVLAGAMIIIAAGLNAIGIVGTIGAVGLLAAAAALAVLAPIMVTLGALSWESILKGLVGLAGVFTILGVAGYLLAPVTPILMGLGAALLLLGAGLALAGVGAMAAATAFGIVVAAGTAGAAVLAHVLTTIIKAIPPALAAFGKGIVQFAVAIGQGAPKIAKAFGQILSNLLDSVIRNVPKMGRAFTVMITTALNVITRLAPRIFAAGLNLIVGFLRAINSRIGEITRLSADIVVKFINGIASRLGKIIQAGVNLILKFIQGVTQAIRNNSSKFGEAGADLGIALIQGIAGAIGAGAGRIKDAALSAAKGAFEAAKDFFKVNSPSKLMRDEIGKPIIEGWVDGIDGDAHKVATSMVGVGRTAVSKLSETMKGVNDAFSLDPNLNPTVTPVLDLSALTKEANKMSSILAAAPIIPMVSYQAAADISSVTQPPGPDDGPGSNGGGGDTYVTYEQHLHSPTPIDSVASYRAGKSLIALKKGELTGS